MLAVAQRLYIEDVREFEDANVSEIARRLQVDCGPPKSTQMENVYIKNSPSSEGYAR